MAKQFYTASEAQEKLGMTANELKELVRDGQLREFRDGGQVKYKTDDVDSLAENLATLSGSLTGTSGELVLEPADETSMGLTGSDMLTLDEADRSEADATIADDDKKEDTVITSVGISVFDDEEVAEVDPRAKTLLDDKKDLTGGSMSLEGLTSSNTATGSGTGLLDLTREADDTSLGAELLDEIYTEDQEAGLPEMGDATRAGLDAAIPEEREPEPIFEQQEALPHRETATRAVVVDARGGAAETALTGALLGAVLVLAIAGICVSANIQGVLPSLVEIFHTKPLYALILLALPILCGVIGLFMGRSRRTA